MELINLSAAQLRQAGQYQHISTSTDQSQGSVSDLDSHLRCSSQSHDSMDTDKFSSRKGSQSSGMVSIVSLKFHGILSIATIVEWFWHELCSLTGFYLTNAFTIPLALHLIVLHTKPNTSLFFFLLLYAEFLFLSLHEKHCYNDCG